MYEIRQVDLFNRLIEKVETLEIAEKRVKELENEDRYLAKLYGWLSLPIYDIRVSMF